MRVDYVKRIPEMTADEQAKLIREADSKVRHIHVDEDSMSIYSSEWSDDNEVSCEME